MYIFWEDFREKLKSGNSCQHGNEMMLIAENAGWDTGGRTADALDGCPALLFDEKPVTARQRARVMARTGSPAPSRQTG